MIERKKKICVECGKERFIFSKGRCEYCAKKEYMSNSKASSKTKRKKRRKKKLQKLSNLKKDARYWFQRYIRYKEVLGNDKDTFCAYGCGTILTDPKKCDAGHYLKAELYPEAIFDEDNVYPVCKGCNIRDPILEYRRNLIEKFGEDWVNDHEEKYMTDRSNYKWDRGFLEEMKEKYKTLCKELEEELSKSKIS